MALTRLFSSPRRLRFSPCITPGLSGPAGSVEAYPKTASPVTHPTPNPMQIPPRPRGGWPARACCSPPVSLSPSPPPPATSAGNRFLCASMPPSPAEKAARSSRKSQPTMAATSCSWAPMSVAFSAPPMAAPPGSPPITATVRAARAPSPSILPTPTASTSSAATITVPTPTFTASGAPPTKASPGSPSKPCP